MADEGDKGRSASGLIALILLAVSALVVKQLPYTSSRPETEKAPLAVGAGQTVAARLWQDPFGAVDQHEREEMRDKLSGVTPPGGHGHGAGAILASVPDHYRPLVIMPMFTLGGRYADDAENRRRLRYAALSAFGVMNYAVVNDRHIGYVALDSGPLRVVPFEMVTGAAADVVLLWIDEDAPWARPLTDLAGVLRSLGLCESDLGARRSRPTRLKVIGPQTAAVTSLIRQELGSGAKRPAACFGDAELYTLSTAYELGDLLDPTAGGASALADRTRAWRTIRRDADVLRALAAELRQRGVNPREHRVLIIGELDTPYARELAYLAYETFCPQGRCAHGYTYFRGLDGFVPTTLPKGETPPGDDSKNGASLWRAFQPVPRERADGNSQLDYLRRMAARIRDIERSPQEHGRVKAVGILGSDVYDKLLLLQALRDALPGALFFTTDLDARFLQPGEFKWARNLIVASTFGLRLADDWQQEVAPFRDAYQTAQFYTVQLALDQWTPGRQAEIDRTLTVRTFEIGRTGAIDLSPPDSGLQPHPVAAVEIGGVLLDRGRVGVALLAAALAALLIVMASLRVRAALGSLARAGVAWRRTAVGGIAALLALIGLGLVVPWASLLARASQEPFAWFEGVSLWPTELIRLVAIVVALVLLGKVVRTMRRAADKLEGDYFKEIAGRPLPAGLTRGWFDSLFGIGMRDQNDKSDIKTELLWQRYRVRTTWGHRLGRILLLSVCFDGLAFLVINQFFEPPFVPYRGAFSASVDFWVLTAAVVCVTLLMFSVTDAIWICLRFTRELGRPVASQWPEKILAQELKRYHLSPDALAYWLDARFVAEWTQELIGIVYYPAAVISLMILARSSIFDRWEPLPLGLVVVVTLGLGFTAGCALSLRRMAERVRDNTRRELTRFLLQAQAAPPRPDPAAPNAPVAEAGSPDQLKSLIADVEKLREGAFAPLSQQPFVRAALLPLSGAGGVAAIEYLLLGH